MMSENPAQVCIKAATVSINKNSRELSARQVLATSWLVWTLER